MKNTRSTNDDNSISTILSRNTFVSNNSHFNVKNWKKSGKLVIQVSGIYEMYYGPDAQG